MNPGAANKFAENITNIYANHCIYRKMTRHTIFYWREGQEGEIYLAKKPKIFID